MSQRIALLSDVHANIAALDAVLEDIEQRGITRLWCLGDVVGRGPAPLITANEMCALYQSQSTTDQACWLAGNHDLMVLDKISTQMFKFNNSANVTHDEDYGTAGGMSVNATYVATEHRNVLNNRSQLMDWLNNLPSYANPLPHIYLAHGRYHFTDDGTVSEIHTHSDYAWDNILPAMMRNMFTHITDDDVPHLILLGHTHQPGIWRWDPTVNTLQTLYDKDTEETVACEDLSNAPLIVNPGSVGFPRGGGCPTYAVLETDADDISAFSHAVTVKIVTVSYDWRANTLPTNYDYPQKYLEEMQTCNP